MRKDVYRVLGMYPPANEPSNYWVSAGTTKKELPEGFDPSDIAEYSQGEIKAGDVVNGLTILKVTETVPSHAILRKTVVNV